MKSRNYQPIDAPINLHLEYQFMTLGELSGILRDWQAILLSGWKKSFELQDFSSQLLDLSSPPSTRILTVSGSTERSYDIVSNYAVMGLTVSSAIFGPVTTWPSVAKTAYAYIHSIWTQKRLHGDRNHLFIKGGSSPEIWASYEVLRDPETGPRIERLWKRATSGEIKITVNQNHLHSE